MGKQGMMNENPWQKNFLNLTKLKLKNLSYPKNF